MWGCVVAGFMGRASKSSGRTLSLTLLKAISDAPLNMWGVVA